MTVRWSSPRQADPQAQLAGSGPWTAIDVQDNGIGIAPQHLSAVFEPFVQAEKGHTRRHGGTGLGLAISRHFCRLMGSDLTVESVYGQGSTFTVRVPATVAPPV